MQEMDSKRKRRRSMRTLRRQSIVLGVGSDEPVDSACESIMKMFIEENTNVEEYGSVWIDNEFFGPSAKHKTKTTSKLNDSYDGELLTNSIAHRLVTSGPSNDLSPFELARSPRADLSPKIMTPCNWFTNKDSVEDQVSFTMKNCNTHTEPQNNLTLDIAFLSDEDAIHISSDYNTIHQPTTTLIHHSPNESLLPAQMHIGHQSTDNFTNLNIVSPIYPPTSLNVRYSSRTSTKELSSTMFGLGVSPYMPDGYILNPPLKGPMDKDVMIEQLKCYDGQYSSDENTEKPVCDRFHKLEKTLVNHSISPRNSYKNDLMIDDHVLKFDDSSSAIVKTASVNPGDGVTHKSVLNNCMSSSNTCKNYDQVLNDLKISDNHLTAVDDCTIVETASVNVSDHLTVCSHVADTSRAGQSSEETDCMGKRSAKILSSNIKHQSDECIQSTCKHSEMQLSEATEKPEGISYFQDSKSIDRQYLFDRTLSQSTPNSVSGHERNPNEDICLTPKVTSGHSAKRLTSDAVNLFRNLAAKLSKKKRNRRKTIFNFQDLSAPFVSKRHKEPSILPVATNLTYCTDNDKENNCQNFLYNSVNEMFDENLNSITATEVKPMFVKQSSDTTVPSNSSFSHPLILNDIENGAIPIHPVYKSSQLIEPVQQQVHGSMYAPDAVAPSGIDCGVIPIHPVSNSPQLIEPVEQQVDGLMHAPDTVAASDIDCGVIPIYPISNSPQLLELVEQQSDGLMHAPDTVTGSHFGCCVIPIHPVPGSNSPQLLETVEQQVDGSLIKPDAVPGSDFDSQVQIVASVPENMNVVGQPEEHSCTSQPITDSDNDNHPCNMQQTCPTRKTKRRSADFSIMLECDAPVSDESENVTHRRRQSRRRSYEMCRRRNISIAQGAALIDVDNERSSPEVGNTTEVKPAEKVRRYRKKNEVILEDLYLNKNFKMPTKKTWETIYEVPKGTALISRNKQHRKLEFESVPPAKQRRRLQKASKLGWSVAGKKRVKLADDYVKNVINAICLDLAAAGID